MKCSRCKGFGRAIVLVKQKEGFYGTEQAVCPECGGTGQIEQTHFEYMQSCSIEEFAEFLLDVWHGIDEVINIMSEDGEINKKDAIVKWLKQPHHEKE